MRRTLRRGARFLSLERGKRRMALEVLGLMALIPAGFRFFGVARTQGWLRRKFPYREQAITPDAVLQLIRSASRGLAVVSRSSGIDGRCLSRSLTLWAILRTRGVETTLAIGYRRSGAEIEGHAWLELDGIPVNEDASVVATYAPATHSTAFDALTPQRSVRWV